MTDQPTSDRRNTPEDEPRRRVVLRGTPAMTSDERRDYERYIRDLNNEMEIERHES